MVDITSADFQLPETSAGNDALYAKIMPIDNAALTTGAVGGTGVFDILMASMKAQLKAEYDASRITGGEYTKAFIELTQAAMQFAVQFLLGRDQAFWAAQTAQIQAIDGRIKLENDRFTYQNLLPMQLNMLTEQANAQRAQTSNTRLDGTTVTGLIGKQEALYSQQITSYQRDAEVKAAKLYTDAWITQKTIDDALTPPSGFTNATIDTILTHIQANNGLS